jgi:hypothetical protein
MFVATSTSNNVAVLRTLPEMVMSAPETSSTVLYIQLLHTRPYQKLVVIETIGFVKPWRVGCGVMFSLFFALLSSVQSCFRSRAALQAEILALRHQLLVLQRSSRNRRRQAHGAASKATFPDASS